MALAGCTPPGSTERARVIDEPLVHAALREQVAPLLGARVSAGELQAPADVRRQLLQAHLACAATDVWMQRASAPVLEALRAQGIPTMLLKGGALLRCVYPAPGWRVMADLDVLVPRARWMDAQAACAGAGAKHLLGRRLVSRLSIRHERAYAAGGALIDLHRTLTAWPLFRVDHEDLFARARVLDDGLLIPAGEDLFISLVIHAAQDGFAVPLRSVIDGYLLAASGQVDPEVLAARAREWGAARATAIWLHVLMAHGLGADPWAAVAKQLADQSAERAASDLPRVVPQSPETQSAERWRARWRLLHSDDSLARPIVFLAYRAALRAGDRLRARLQGAH